MPVITLTTDFGSRDSYVAEMKGVILAIAPQARIVDVTHEIARHDIVEGALALEAVVPAFPAGTIHVAVVDPGVGTRRRGLVVDSGGHLFVGPDNGIFSAFLRGRQWRAWALRSRRFRRTAVSRTFHGRDVFAPASAHLALGVAPSRVGPVVGDPARLDLGTARRVRGSVRGRVVLVDRFGNLITSIRSRDLADLRGRLEAMIAARWLPFVGTYGALPPRGAGALLGSQDRVEIALREGHAASLMSATRGTPVVVRPVRAAVTSTRRSRA